MADFHEKSFDYANEVTKLILSLATGVLAFTMTFMKDMIGENTIHSKNVLILSWGFIIFTVLCCLWTLQSIAGTLNKLHENPNLTPKPGIYDTNIRIPSSLSLFFFILGMILMAVFTLNNFPNTGSVEKKVVTAGSVKKSVPDTTVIVVDLQVTNHATQKKSRAFSKGQRHQISNKKVVIISGKDTIYVKKGEQN